MSIIQKKVICRPGCAACCTVISISSPLPGMPSGKPAGVRCVNLDDNSFCTIHNTDEYPKVCVNFKPSYEMCGDNNDFAHKYLKEMEEFTQYKL